MPEIDLTPAEERAIRALQALAKWWPRSLWLFSASGALCVMRAGPNGEQVADGLGSVDREYFVTSIDIPNDGGDW